MRWLSHIFGAAPEQAEATPLPESLVEPSPVVWSLDFDGVARCEGLDPGGRVRHFVDNIPVHLSDAWDTGPREWTSRDEDGRAWQHTTMGVADLLVTTSVPQSRVLRWQDAGARADETAREWSERRSTVNRAIISAIWDHPSALVALVDSSGKIHVQAGGAQRAMGLPPGATTWAGQYIPQGAPSRVLRTVIREERAVSYRLAWTAPDGTERYYHGSGAPWYSGTGKLKGCIFFAFEAESLEPEITGASHE